jgi:hypothetical protein
MTELYELTEVEIEVLKILTERNQKGREIYGHGLNHNDDYNWLDMAIEEAADLFKYLVAERLRQKNKMEKR